MSALTNFRQITELDQVGEHDGLLFELLDGSTHRALHVDRRNEVFSQIVGYTDLPWKRTG